MTTARNPQSAQEPGFGISRRAAIERILGISVTALLAACAPAAAPTPPKPTISAAATPAPTVILGTPPPAASAGATTPAPAGPAPIKTGGTLRTGMVGDIVTIDGILWQPNNSATVGMCYDALITYDDNLQPQPRLAESWDLSSDGTRIKLNLRKGVHFHSRRELTSADVQYNVLRARDPKNPFAAVVAAGSAWWTGIDTPDKYTVILTSEK